MTQSGNTAQAQVINRRYRLLKELGQGGMGTVYRATDRLTGQNVALKLVTSTAPSDVPESFDYRLTLANEFKVLASLRHPHVINVIDYGFDEQQRPFFTMELLEGARSFLDGEADQPNAVKAQQLIELLQAVAYLHRRSVLHRDLKPGNVLITSEGMLKVLDFGLATDDGQQQELAGTLAYMAPELLEGYPVSTASDLYAIGVMAYELFTGRHPYHDALAEGAGPLINAMLTRQPDFSPLAQVANGSERSTKRRTEDRPIEHRDDGENDEKTEIYNPDTVLDITIKLNKTEKQSGIASDEYDELDTTRAIAPESDFDPSSTLEMRAFYADEPLSLRTVVGRLLDKYPEGRYSDAYEVIDDLCTALDLRQPEESPAIRESFLQAATFVGRDRELQILSDALDAAKEGKGSSWLIAGESGVGKSRLMDEIRIRALVSGMMVLRGKGVTGGGVSYQLWREPLRRLILTAELSPTDASIFKDIVPDIEQLVEYPVPDAVEVEANEYTQRLQGAITSLFQRQTSPVLLLLEDLQWLEESLDVLKLLNGMVNALPVLIVGNFRYEEKPDLPSVLPQMNLLRLERLTSEGIAELSASILGAEQLNQSFLNFLNRETGGNAFFIVEVLRTLAEEVGRLDEVSSSTLPEELIAGGVTSVIQRRLDKVSNAERQLLDLAAVIGRLIDISLLSYLRPSADIDAWITTCSNYAILDVMDENWQFAHDKMREAILETIDVDSLKALHTEVAKGLSEFDQSDERAGQIARHWQIAGDSFHECLFSQRAGIHALEIGVFHEAKSYLERSLSLAESLSAAELEKLPHSRAQVLFSLAESLQYLAEYAQAMAYAQEALAIYRNANDELHVAYTYNLLGDIAWHQGDYDEGLEYCAISHNYAHNLNDLLLMARALNRTGMIHVQQGDYDTASENFAKSLDTLRRLDAQGDLAGVLNNIGLIAYYKGQFDEASNYFEESIAISRDIGERHRAAGTLMNMGSIAGITGDFVQAETYFRDSLSVAREIGNRRYAAQCLNNLGHLAFLKGDLDEAEQFLQESWPISEAIGNRAQVAQTMGNIGNIYRERGNIELADEYYTEAIAIAFEADAYAILMEVLLSKAEVTEDLEEKCTLLDIVVRHAATEETDRQTAIKLRESLQADAKPGHPVLEDVVAQLLKNKTGS